MSDKAIRTMTGHDVLVTCYVLQARVFSFSFGYTFLKKSLSALAFSFLFSSFILKLIILHAKEMI